MAALINGLAVSLTNNVIGNLAHVRLEPLPQEPRTLTTADGACPRRCAARERGSLP
ncbi:MAG: hypothetical protein IPK85_01140 [Gemmatimonadetes bacterium]|nr:hypothetical protein [Gemmatimonadota bacterium]